MTKLPRYETNLIGYLQSGITPTATTIAVKFEDRVTGEAREPQTDTDLFVIDKGTAAVPNERYEIIQKGAATTTDGVTTMTSCVRGLAFYGTSLAAVVANQKSHVAGAEVGCVDVHFLADIANAILSGDLDVTEEITFAEGIYIADLKKVKIGADAYVTTTNDGLDLILKDGNNTEITLSDLTAAAGTDQKVSISATDTSVGFLGDKLTAGEGLAEIVVNPASTETLSLSVDRTDTNAFVGTSAGAADDGKAIVLDPDGLVDESFIPPVPAQAGDGSDGVQADSDLTITGSNDTYITKNFTTWTAGSVARTCSVTPTGCVVHLKIQGDADFTNWTFDFEGSGSEGGAGGDGQYPANASAGSDGVDPTTGLIYGHTGGTGGSGGGGGSAGSSNGGGGGGGGGASYATSGSTGTDATGGDIQGTGGAGGVKAPVPVNISMLNEKTLLVSPGSGGGGGGGGGGGISSGSGQGGVGGNGGGCLVIEVGGDLTLSASSFNLAGADGADGQSDTQGGAGGGGGGGGMLAVFYRGSLSGSVSSSVLGGAGGTGNTGSTVVGGDGGIGAAGSSILIHTT